MAPRRRRAKRREDVTPEQEAWLQGKDGGDDFFYFKLEEDLAQFWREHGERVVAEHVEQWPGTRPRRWWIYDAPEPRKRLGGIGTPSHEVLAHVEHHDYGIPKSRIEPWAVSFYNGLAKDIHGHPIGVEYFGRGFAGRAIDPDNPPTYESQGAYLDRHGLFLPGERRRLRKADFEPEAVCG